MLSLNKETLKETLNKERTLVIDFASKGCDESREFDSILHAAEERHTQPQVEFAHCDAGAQPEVADVFGVQDTPTLAIVRDGILVFREPGVIPGHVVDELIGRVQLLDMDQIRKDVESQHQA